MPGQLTTALRRARLPLGRGPVLVPEGADPAVERAARVRERLPQDEKSAFDGWSADRPEAAPVLTRALAATGRLAPVGELASAWDGWDVATRQAVVDPARQLASAMRQVDATACGSAVLAMLAAAGDPTLAAWLTVGWVGSARPAELSNADDRSLEALSRREPSERAQVLQRVIKRRSVAHGLGLLGWPGAWGTPPWGAARVARYPGVRWTHRVVDDTDAEQLRDLWSLVAGWVQVGVPIPLYAGGDSSGGWAEAVPRHVVLAVGGTDRGLEVFEPSTGRLLELARDGEGRREALGGWGHLDWVLLPH
ncbi:hypothetical protein Q6346_08645 [Isoptericola sp. b490]|uniref:hypothetical protein n=1 Tax=Actinotalea lenta TaxID=3064654 RepID=UPI002712274A|nr:hypothetical protein [Isoptericola sp. b490]MDO8121378.1 hypothetical protein [Isoptericola sp. b490]